MPGRGGKKTPQTKKSSLPKKDSRPRGDEVKANSKKRNRESAKGWEWISLEEGNTTCRSGTDRGRGRLILEKGPGSSKQGGGEIRRREEGNIANLKTDNSAGRNKFSKTGDFRGDDHGCDVEEPRISRLKRRRRKDDC